MKCILSNTTAVVLCHGVLCHGIMSRPTVRTASTKHRIQTHHIS